MTIGLVTFVNTRSESQNNALHLGCKILAEELNNQGNWMGAVFKHKEVDVPWTKTTVKEALFKPIMQYMYGHTSTAELEKSEVSEVWDALLNHLVNKNCCEYIPFPSEDNDEH